MMQNNKSKIKFWNTYPSTLKVSFLFSFTSTGMKHIVKFLVCSGFQEN